ncbi:hypothetical protein IWZ03DRAFT_237609 [Phyllosticta citriasiana]|uniref:Uncharacterized protein n=1 Tax=Phyllosticta citriasiana TaxID=595635 RepID=A0ABR1KFX7_9PEZI
MHLLLFFCRVCCDWVCVWFETGVNARGEGDASDVMVEGRGGAKLKSFIQDVPPCERSTNSRGDERGPPSTPCMTAKQVFDLQHNRKSQPAFVFYSHDEEHPVSQPASSHFVSIHQPPLQPSATATATATATCCQQPPRQRHPTPYLPRFPTTSPRSVQRSLKWSIGPHSATPRSCVTHPLPAARMQ